MNKITADRFSALRAVVQHHPLREVLGGMRHLAWKLGETARGLRILRGFEVCPDRDALAWFLRPGRARRGVRNPPDAPFPCGHSPIARPFAGGRSGRRPGALDDRGVPDGPQPRPGARPLGLHDPARPAAALPRPPRRGPAHRGGGGALRGNRPGGRSGPSSADPGRGGAPARRRRRLSGAPGRGGPLDPALRLGGASWHPAPARSADRSRRGR